MDVRGRHGLMPLIKKLGVVLVTTHPEFEHITGVGQLSSRENNRAARIIGKSPQESSSTTELGVSASHRRRGGKAIPTPHVLRLKSRPFAIPHSRSTSLSATSPSLSSRNLSPLVRCASSPLSPRSTDMPSQTKLQPKFPIASYCCVKTVKLQMQGETIPSEMIHHLHQRNQSINDMTFGEDATSPQPRAVKPSTTFHRQQQRDAVQRRLPTVRVADRARDSPDSLSADSVRTRQKEKDWVGEWNVQDMEDVRMVLRQLKPRSLPREG